jgi:hypothetical protein
VFSPAILRTRLNELYIERWQTAASPSHADAVGENTNNGTNIL